MSGNTVVKIERYKKTYDDGNENLVLQFHFMCNWHWENFQKGWFSNTIEREMKESYCFMNPFNGTINLGIVREPEKHSVINDLYSEGIDWGGTFNIENMAQLETVDGNAWDGRERFSWKNQNGVAIYTAPPIWLVLMTDKASGNVFPFLNAQNSRNEVFRIQSRFQMFLDYTRSFMNGWEERIEHHRKIEARRIYDLKDSDDIEQGREMMASMSEYLTETKPQWDWIVHKGR